VTSQILSQQSSTALDAFVNLLRANAATTRSLSAQLHAQHGLTINDYEALLRLSRADDGLMRRVDLAEALLLTPSGVTRLLDGLERSGLVEKQTCPSDARVTYACLTDAGKVKLKEASHSHVAEVQALFREHYTEEELETLAVLLARLSGGSADAEACTVDA
jgi:DNA-binding MarR family transcriptional regulator